MVIDLSPISFSEGVCIGCILGKHPQQSFNAAKAFMQHFVGSIEACIEYTLGNKCLNPCHENTITLTLAKETILQIIITTTPKPGLGKKWAKIIGKFAS